MMNEERVLRDALLTWGFHSQRLIWIEELAELIQALAKHGRVVNGSERAEIENELADVDICLSQMKLLFPGWIEVRKQKMLRLADLLSKRRMRNND